MTEFFAKRPWQGTVCTVWKNAKFSLTEFFSSNQFFSKYNFFSLVKTLNSRNFCQKCVRVNFRNFYTVEVPKKLISRNLFDEREFLEKEYIVEIAVFYWLQGGFHKTSVKLPFYKRTENGFFLTKWFSADTQFGNYRILLQKFRESYFLV